MQKFLARFGHLVTGVLSGFDRLLFRGTLRRLCYPMGLEGFLAFRNICRKDFGDRAEQWTDRIKERALEDARARDIPIEHLTSGAIRKENVARRYLEERKVSQGPICVLTAVEPCTIWHVYHSREKKRIEFQRRPGRCQHIYHYFNHPDFGLMYTRLQTWMPYALQVGLNGREWLGRQMQRAGMRFTQVDNSFPFIEDVPRAQSINDGFLDLPWQSFLDELALKVHPTLPEILGGFKASYYWTVQQSEWATDVMFRDPQSLARLYRAIVRHSMTDLRSDDIFQFLGKKLTGNYQGEVLARFRRRLEGICVKFTAGLNWLKFYDKFGWLLRLEPTINFPRFFLVLRRAQGQREDSRKLRPLRGSVCDLQLRANVCQAINKRVLDNFATVADPTPVKDLVDGVTRPAELGGRRVRAMQPWSKPDVDLLAAVARGEFLIQGFRNRDLVPLLHLTPSQDQAEQRRRSARVTRQIRLLRAHGLVEKVRGTHRYLVTRSGAATIAAILGARELPLSAVKQAA